MRVDAGSLLSNQKDRNKQMAMSMATNNLLAVKTLYKKLEMPDEDYAEYLKEQQEGIHTGHAKGSGSRTGRGQRNGKAA